MLPFLFLFLIFMCVAICVDRNAADGYENGDGFDEVSGKN